MKNGCSRDSVGLRLPQPKDTRGAICSSSRSEVVRIAPVRTPGWCELLHWHFVHVPMPNRREPEKPASTAPRRMAAEAKLSLRRPRVRSWQRFNRGIGCNAARPCRHAPLEAGGWRRPCGHPLTPEIWRRGPELPCSRCSITDRNWRLRYPVAAPAPMLMALRKILPESTFLRLIRRQDGI